MPPFSCSVENSVTLASLLRPEGLVANAKQGNYKDEAPPDIGGGYARTTALSDGRSHLLFSALYMVLYCQCTRPFPLVPAPGPCVTS